MTNGCAAGRHHLPLCCCESGTKAGFPAPTWHDQGWGSFTDLSIMLPNTCSLELQPLWRSGRGPSHVAGLRLALEQHSMCAHDALFITQHWHHVISINCRLLPMKATCHLSAYTCPRQWLWQALPTIYLQIEDLMGALAG